jgi:uncharacterized membrane protein YidH (DUF202 family)
MENPTPFNLNEAIRRWQQNLGASPAFCADNLEELASHLRASVRRLKADGFSEEEAFLIAARRIGERGPLEREFAKVNPTVTWSLPVFLFWIVAGMYLFQAVYSLISGIPGLGVMFEMRDFVRLIAAGAPLAQLYQAFPSRLCFHLPHSRTVSIVVALVFILGARLAAGSWKGVGAFIRSFERPIRTALGLVVFGLVVTLLPAFFPSFRPSWGLRGFVVEKTNWPMDNYAVGQAAVNVVLVLIMVLLARRGLRKISPADGTPHNRAASISR